MNTTAEPGGPSRVVAVRALAEFTAKAGDLDHRFTPVPTAEQGMAGHRAVAGRRGTAYEAEVALSGTHRGLLVRGRADGFDPAARRLEEIKTHRGDLRRLPANQRALHWAQARLYAALLCEQRGLEEIEVALVYFDIGSGAETIVAETQRRAALRCVFEQHCERFLAWADTEAAHRAARDAALSALAFAHVGFRPGQRELAAAVYRVTLAGGCLVAQAPTGIGKTLATLYGALRAAPSARVDKLFFVTARTTGRAVALDALARLAGDSVPLRSLELVSRETACEHPDRACHGESCPLARGFYDRLPAARAAALAVNGAAALTRARLREVALAHDVCPYYLGQELVRWADVVVGDMNHWYDLHATLQVLSLQHEWRVMLLVDEAHNLVERARAMYSATSSRAALAAARRQAPAALRRPLERVQRQWAALLKAQAEPYRIHAEPPVRFVESLRQAATALADHWAEQPPASSSPLQEWFFEALHFLQIAERFGAHSIVELEREPQATARRASEAALHLRNLVPAPLLAPRHAACHASVLFSATLRPERYHADLLGLPAGARRIELASPFDPERLDVRIATRISTRYADRSGSLPAIADLMARQFAAAPGNYLAFFSSYAYLHQAAEALHERDAGIVQWQQARESGPGGERGRAEFLARFVEGGQGIGFAVLGGAFGEGIDLPGERLIGAFIATLGLPPASPRSEAVKARLQAMFGRGDDYAYLYPGVQKVVQAAGRVIRTPADRGVVVLMDDRFARPEVRRLLPPWWIVRRDDGAGN